MIVMEYEMKFSALSHFATAQLTDDNFKGACFEEGLKPGIQNKLAPLRLKSFIDILGAALAIENKELQLKKNWEANPPPKSHQSWTSQYQFKKLRTDSFLAP